MSKIDKTNTTMLPIGKKQSSIRHLKWAVPITVGVVAGAVPLGFAIYGLSQSDKDIEIIKRLKEFDKEIAEEFFEKDGSFVPNFEFIKYITNGQNPSTPEIRNEFFAKYPHYENVIESGSFKYIVNTPRGSYEINPSGSFDIQEGTSASRSIFGHGSDYKLFDIFNKDIPEYLAKLPRVAPIDLDLSTAPTAPVPPVLEDYSKIVPTITTKPDEPSRDALALVEADKPIEPTRANAEAETTTTRPNQPDGVQSMEDFIADINRLGVSGRMDSFPVDASGNYLYTFINVDNQPAVSMIKSPNWHAVGKTEAASVLGVDVNTLNEINGQVIIPMSPQEAYLASIRYSSSQDVRDYYAQMVLWNDAVIAKLKELETTYNSEIVTWTGRYNTAKDAYDTAMNQYREDLADYQADQERMQRERDSVDSRNEQKLATFNQEYIQYEARVSEWKATLAGQEKIYVDQISRQIQVLSTDPLSPFASDPVLYQFALDEINGIFNRGLLTDVETAYNSALNRTRGDAEINSLANFFDKYMSDIITGEQFKANPNITLGEIPYFMGMAEGRSISFEYEITTNVFGNAIIPADNVGEERFNTFWLAGDDSSDYSEDDVIEFRKNERGN